jgi:hypothetical protein
MQFPSRFQKADYITSSPPIHTPETGVEKIGAKTLPSEGVLSYDTGMSQENRIPPVVLQDLSLYMSPGEKVLDALASTSGPVGKIGELWMILTDQTVYFHTREHGKDPVVALIARKDLNAVDYEPHAEGVTLTYIPARFPKNTVRVPFTKDQTKQVNAFCEELAKSAPVDLVEASNRPALPGPATGNTPGAIAPDRAAPVAVPPSAKRANPPLLKTPKSAPPPAQGTLPREFFTHRGGPVPAANTPLTPPAGSATTTTTAPTMTPVSATTTSSAISATSHAGTTPDANTAPPTTPMSSATTSARTLPTPSSPEKISLSGTPSASATLAADATSRPSGPSAGPAPASSATSSAAAPKAGSPAFPSPAAKTGPGAPAAAATSSAAATIRMPGASPASPSTGKTDPASSISSGSASAADDVPVRVVMTATIISVIVGFLWFFLFRALGRRR